MDKRKILEKVLQFTVIGAAIGGVAYFSQKANKKDKEMLQRYKSYYTTTNQWLTNKMENKDMGKYFTDNHINTIAIYGMGSLGELFYKDIKSHGVKVSCFIDKNAEELYYGMDDIAVVPIAMVNDQEKVDAIIVTPVYDFEEISSDLMKLGVDTEIISLEDIIYE